MAVHQLLETLMSHETVMSQVSGIELPGVDIVTGECSTCHIVDIAACNKAK